MAAFKKISIVFLLLVLASGLGLIQARVNLSATSSDFIRQQTQLFNEQMSHEIFQSGESSTLDQLSKQWQILFPFVEDTRLGFFSECEVQIPLRKDGKLIQTLSICFSHQKIILESLMSKQALVGFFILFVLGVIFLFIHQKQKIQNEFIQHVLKEKELRIQLSRGLIHDLKSPLQALEILAEILKNHSEAGSFLSKATIRLRGLIKELNQQSLEDSQVIGSSSLGFENQNLNDLISEFEHRKSEVLWLRNRQALEGIPLDLKLSRLFQNLFENALEANAQRINIDVKTKQAGIFIQVSDDGVGLSSEKAKLLGKEPMASQKANGSGQGLFLVLEELKNHKIEVQFFSEIGSGMIVQVLIPESYLSGLLNFQTKLVLKSGF